METPALETASAEAPTSKFHPEDKNVNQINSAVAVAANAEVAGSIGRPYETRGFDEFSHQLKRHRSDLHALDQQLQKLDEAIEADQRRIQEHTMALEEKFRARGRMLAVRVAMARFVETLQAKDGK